MPRKRSKSSRVTEWVVQPWYPVQRTRLIPSATARPREDDESEHERDIPKDFTKETAAKLRQGLDELRTRLVLPREVLEPEEIKGYKGWWHGPCLLAFEESNGHFVGLFLDKEVLQPHLVLFGTKQRPFPLDCRFHDAQGKYEMHIAEIGNTERCQQVFVMHTGGDVARLDTVETSKTFQLCFRCVELFGNSTPSSPLRAYFDDEEVIVNVGVLWISGWQEE